MKTIQKIKSTLALIAMLCLPLMACSKENNLLEQQQLNDSKTKGAGFYAGVHFLNGKRYDECLYLRDNGTYTTDFKSNDWRTKVDGKYTVSGNTLKLTSNTGYERTLKYNSTFDKIDGSWRFFKLEIGNRAPEGKFEYENANYSIDNSPHGSAVAGGNQSFFYFDGKGSFSNDVENYVTISGQNIGGGSSSSQHLFGTYTVKDAILTLKYNNGTTQSHTFFYRIDPENNNTMIVLDGKIYFPAD